MKREVKLSLLVLILVVSSVFFLGVNGVSCEIWSKAALSGAKKVGTKIVLREIHHSDLLNLPLDRFPFLERYLTPGI